MIKSLAAATVLAALSPFASAGQPASLGQLLDLGAQKLSSGEVQSLGDLRIVRKAADADSYMTMRGDRTVVGMVHNKQGHGSSEAVGTWQLQPDGQRCVAVQLPAFRMEMNQCGYTYRLGKDIFFAPSDSDRTVAVTHYTENAFLE
ncbi:hypothetical protein GHT07_13240 [Caenimonas koreensis DSM 17982]|uniref:Uncharacterized protein n=1 Tax=Caenimonas koreensis DSM 17982 TaxID=1121255 RepID=A0A844B0L0_9BURK|nr:hypothetical protein [Caenimonas koreensis]MRD48248.1 hypothetical protein [Caenimonas koreensis DSM 17982]